MEAMLTTQWKMMKHMKDKPVNHAPYTVTIPSNMTETEFLRKLARKGATMVTLNGERVAQLGHAVRMNNTYPTFPSTKVTRSGSVSGVSVSRMLGASNADLARGDASEY
jgi:hypothetical protein